jgi:hypothetical protein
MGLSFYNEESMIDSIAAESLHFASNSKDSKQPDSTSITGDDDDQGSNDTSIQLSDDIEMVDR